MTCFALMPFGNPFDFFWEDIIRPTLTEAGIQVHRADDVFRPGIIINDIFQSLEDCSFVVADLTNRNPNVFYELGYAHALGKPSVLISQTLEDVPFDLKHRRVLVYKDSGHGAAQLSRALSRSIQDFVK